MNQHNTPVTPNFGTSTTTDAVKGGMVADTLAERGFCVLQNVMPPEIVAGLISACHLHEQQGDLNKAEIGGGSAKQLAPNRRGDHILWWSENPDNPSQAAFSQWLTFLKDTLAAQLRLPLDTFEVHFAVYPPGAGYEAHIDQIRGRGFRRLSMVYYLNSDWQAEWGGQLRMHLENDTEDIQPLGNTMILFRSDTMRHEVLPTMKTRRSITGWFRSASTGQFS